MAGGRVAVVCLLWDGGNLHLEDRSYCRCPPEHFDAQARRTVLSPGDYGLTWIKDPFVMAHDGAWWLYAAVPPRTGPSVSGNTVTAGPLDATVLAVSQDGRYFPEIEYVFEAPTDDSWHGRRARISSVIPWNCGFLAFFDGGRAFHDNYEEKAGLARSPDGRIFTRLDTGAPGFPRHTVRFSAGCLWERKSSFVTSSRRRTDPTTRGRHG